MSSYKQLIDENFESKTNPKRVLFMQYEPNSVELSDTGPTSGTAKCGLELFKYLNSFNEYSCTYIGGEGIPTGDEDFCNEHFDIVVFNHIMYKENFSIIYKKLKETNKNVKSIFIVHCLDYWHLEEYQDRFFNEVDEIVCVGLNSYKQFYDKRKDKSTYHLIYNPVNVSYYENLDKNKVENKIMILYHHLKGNITYFIENILPLIKEEIPDINLTICSPNYWCNMITNLGHYCKNIDNITFLGTLQKEELIKELSITKCVFAQPNKIENMPYSVIEATMANCIILCEYINDGACQVNSDYYKTKFKAPSLNNHEEFAQYVIDKIKNYDNYKTDIEYEKTYVVTKFRKENVLPLWKNIFDKL